MMPCSYGRVAAWAWLLLLALGAEQYPPAGYSLKDPHADHDSVAKTLASANRLVEAIESFRAAAKYSGEVSNFANLGVALMRNQDFATAWKAMKRAFDMNPTDSNTKDNFEVLYDFARQNGYDKKKLEEAGAKAKLDLSPAKGARESKRGPSKTKDPESYADNKGVKAEARSLRSALEIGNRAKELFSRSEKKLGRGFLSLALHIDPWLHLSLPWVQDMVRDDRAKMTYWKGNIFLGWDKTRIEDVTNYFFRDVDEPEVYELAIYAWRNLQLAKHSCCGIDNLAVFLSRARKFGHPHICPFLHLTPDYIAQLKPDNQVMYNSFKQWWESNGRMEAPAPRITFDGKETWDWEMMKVVMSPSRVPEGWEAFTQAVLLYRLREYEGARAALNEAMSINSDIALVIDEFMPGLSSLALPRPGVINPASKGKYIVCYSPQVGLGNVAVVIVSAMNLAKLTGRTLVLHWNTNVVSRHAWELRDVPGVKLLGEAAPETGVVQDNMKSIYLFHMMNSKMLGETLELLGCSDLTTSLNAHRLVAVSSNMYFNPILRTNPYTKPSHNLLNFHQGLQELLTPSAKAKKRALSYANKTGWASSAPIIAVHIRAREEGEDNDDWPTADSPEEAMLVSLTKCIEQAVLLEFGDVKEWDLFIAATTEKARKSAADELKKNAQGLRRVLMLPKIERNRRTGAGAVDAMAEALLVSRADIFVRFVVGTSGFSTFAYLSNALRWQTDWAAALPPLRSEGFAPNYVVTNDCGPETHCFEAPPEVRMAEISWHGKQTTGRSCGDVIERLEQKTGCTALKPAGAKEEDEEL